MPNPTIIAFSSSKGGAGKSTSCASIAGALLSAGETVHIIDFDFSQTIWRWYSTNPNVRAFEKLTVQSMPELPTTEREEVRDDGETITVIETAKVEDVLEAVVEEHPTGYILLDLAGAMNRTLLAASVAADLVITPAKVSEPDIVEANKLFVKLVEIGQKAGKPVTHRILLNEVPHAVGDHQIQMMKQLESSALPRFRTIIHQRAAYSKTFSSGCSPHFLPDRQAAAKAIWEIDDLMREIRDILHNQQQRAAA